MAAWCYIYCRYHICIDVLALASVILTDYGKFTQHITKSFSVLVATVIPTHAVLDFSSCDSLTWISYERPLWESVIEWELAFTLLGHGSSVSGEESEDSCFE